MTIIPAHRLGANDTNGLTPSGSASSYATTASITPTAGRWAVVTVESAVASGDANSPTVSAFGLTWALITDGVVDADVAFESGRQRLTKWWARIPTPAPASDDIALTFGGQTQASCRLLYEEFEGVDAVGADVPIQVKVATGTAVASLAATLSSFATGSAVLATGASKATGTVTAGAPLALLGQTTNATGKLYAGFYAGTDLTPDLTFGAANHCALIAIELGQLDPTGSWSIEVDMVGEAVDTPPIDPPGDATIASLADPEPIVIRVRDASLGLVAEIPNTGPGAVLRHEFVLNRQDVSTWHLELPADSPAAPFLRDAQAGIVVSRKGRTLLSGPVQFLADDFEDGIATLIVAGVDDTALLRQPASPEPATAAPPYPTHEYDVRTGLAESVMHAFVNANLGPGALVSRRKDGLVMGTDGAHGATVTGRARFHTLLEVLQTVARSSVAAGGADLNFRILQQGNQLVFTTSVPVDRSATAKFSVAMGNLRRCRYEQEAPKANRVIVAGQGEGTARAFEIAEDPVSIARWGLIEAFVDRRDVPTGAELAAAADEALLEAAGQSRLSITPVDLEDLAYGIHYDVGDLATIGVVIPTPVDGDSVPYGSAGDTYGDMFSGTGLYDDFGQATPASVEVGTVVGPVVQVVLTYEPGGGEQIKPQVGTGPILDPFPGVLNDVRALKAAVAALNRR